MPKDSCRNPEIFRNGDLEIGFGPGNCDCVNSCRPRDGNIVCFAGSHSLVGMENRIAPKSLGGLRSPEVLPIRPSRDRPVAIDVTKRIVDRKRQKNRVVPLQLVQEDLGCGLVGKRSGTVVNDDMFGFDGLKTCKHGFTAGRTSENWRQEPIIIHGALDLFEVSLVPGADHDPKRSDSLVQQE